VGGASAVDQRCTSLRAFADVMVAALRNEFRVQLLKLPKKVRIAAKSAMPPLANVSRPVSAVDPEYALATHPS